MSTARRMISNPREIELPAVLAPPKMLLQQSYRPSGVAFGPEVPGRFLRAFPGYLELACRTNLDCYLVTYIVPVEEEVNLLLACIGETFDPFFECATGPDFGDGVSSLVATHWPEVFRMLAESRSTPVRSRILVRVSTATRRQWAVAEPVHGPWGDFDLSDQQILDLVGSATALMLDAVHFPVRLPGVIQVLGGPDRTSRRLKALAGLFSGGADLVGVFQEGVDVTELLEVAKAAAGIVENGLALRD